MIKQEIENLLKIDLFEELNLKDLSLEEKISIFSQMADIVFQSIWIRILENLNNEQRLILENKILANEFKTSEEFNDYLKSLIPDFEELIKEEIANYKKILITKYI